MDVVKRNYVKRFLYREDASRLRFYAYPSNFLSNLISLMYTCMQ